MTPISTPEEVYTHELRQHNEQRPHYEMAKLMTTIEAKEIDTENKDDLANSIHWQPGVAARFPWLGFAAILTMLTCIAFSIVILLTSDTKVREQWPVELKWEWITNKWKKRAQLTPSVALAITNTVSNVALAIAIGQGVAIAWWRKALKGATVEDLHRSWSFSASVLELLTAGKAFNLVALAALTAKMALVDNLLLQKAAGTSPSFYAQNHINVRVPSWQEQLPAGYVGYFNEDGSLGSYARNFSNVLHDYATDTDFVSIYNIDSFLSNTCDGTCFTNVPGFGFAINCTVEKASDKYVITKDIAKNYTLYASDTTDAYVNMTFPLSNGGNSSFPPPLVSFFAFEDIAGTNTTNSTISGIGFSVSWAQLMASDGNVTDLDTDKCTLTAMSKTCTLRPALLEYTVEITNTDDYTRSVSSKSTNGIRLSSSYVNPDALTNDTATVVDSFDPNATPDPFRGGQLADWNIKVLKSFEHNSSYDMNIRGWTQMISGMFSGDVQLGYLDDTSAVNGFFAHGFGATSGNAIGNWWTPYYDYRTNTESCVINTTDPSVYIMEQVNHITFRTSIYAGDQKWRETMYNSSDMPIEPLLNNFLKTPNATLPYVSNSIAAQFSATLQYNTSKPFMYGAIFTMFFCVLCVLPSYWGFWELGRKVTLGPMEIASAFQAPVLAHPTVNRKGGEVDTLLKEVGARKVRYGEVEGSGRLAVAEPAEVKQLTVPSAHWRPGRHSHS